MNGFKGELCAADEIYSKETTSQVARDLVERKRQIIISLRRILFYNKKGIVWIPSFSFCFLKKFLTRLLTPIQCIPNFNYIPQTHTHARARINAKMILSWDWAHAQHHLIQCAILEKCLKIFRQRISFEAIEQPSLNSMNVSVFSISQKKNEQSSRWQLKQRSFAV